MAVAQQAWSAGAKPAASDPPASPGWQGVLRLDFAQRGERTALVRKRHQGPLVVQRTFHPEGAACHAYLLHPPGGLVGGDELDLSVAVGEGAHALMTTPGAAKFYRSLGDWSTQRQVFRLAPGAAFEWLPMETILHGGSRSRLINRFELGEGARLIAWEMVALGRPGSGDHFPRGALDQRLDLDREQVPLLRERLSLDADDPLRKAPWGLQGQAVFATLLASPAPEGLERNLREALQPPSGVRMGVTRCPEGLLAVRVLGPGVEPVRQTLEQVWWTIREPVVGRPPCPPRIWST